MGMVIIIFIITAPLAEIINVQGLTCLFYVPFVKQKCLLKITVIYLEKLRSKCPLLMHLEVRL
jgi:hypothetical protein